MIMKYVECDFCKKMLSGEDTVIAVLDDKISKHFCSEKCLRKALCIETYNAEYYISSICSEREIKEEETYNDRKTDLPF